jgi:hypothetical protein
MHYLESADKGQPPDQIRTERAQLWYDLQHEQYRRFRGGEEMRLWWRESFEIE